MLGFLPPFLRGVVAMMLLILNTAVCFVPFLLVALIKLIIPVVGVRTICTRWLEHIVTLWVAGNGSWYRLTRRPNWDVKGVDGLDLDSLDPEEWYLVGSNHRSWADIFVLQSVFNRRIPMLKFFLKQELIWVPVMGFCWWALDFPFMKRYSRDYLARHPEKKGKDLETTKKSIAAFKRTPSSVIIFVEGTRFSPEKHQRQAPPYKQLLRPKAGGLGYVLTLMGDQVESLLNITILYPNEMNRSVGFWDYMTGRLNDVIVRVEKITIPTAFRTGDYVNNSAYRESFQEWVNELWGQKDRLIGEVVGKSVRA